MCIHEQLETLHDTMSAHMKTYKMWMSSKTILRNVLYSSSKQDLKRIKGNYLEVFLSIIPFFERTEFWIYNTIEVTSQNRGDRTTAVRHPHLLWDQKKKKGKKKKTLLSGYTWIPWTACLIFSNRALFSGLWYWSWFAYMSVRVVT